MTLNLPAPGNWGGEMNLETQPAPGNWSEVRIYRSVEDQRIDLVTINVDFDESRHSSWTKLR